LDVKPKETDFANLEQLTDFIKGIVGGLLSPATIIIDNLVALSLETLTGKAVKPPSISTALAKQ